MEKVNPYEVKYMTKPFRIANGDENFRNLTNFIIKTIENKEKKFNSHNIEQLTDCLKCANTGNKELIKSYFIETFLKFMHKYNTNVTTLSENDKALILKDVVTAHDSLVFVHNLMQEMLGSLKTEDERFKFEYFNCMKDLKNAIVEFENSVLYKTAIKKI